MRQPLPPDVQAAIARGDKIEAIRLLRASTDVGLAEAKEAVERGHLEGAVASTGLRPGGLTPDAAAALLAGNKIEAIKLVREASGLGLKEAKDLVDQFEGEARTRAPGLAPGEVPRASLGWWFAIVTVVVSVVVAWLVLRRQ